MKDRPRVLLFDVMDTLVKDPFFTVYPRFFECDMDTLFRHKCPDAWTAFERGELTEEAYLARAFKDGRTFDHATLFEEVRDAWDWIDGMQALVASLATDDDVSLHILSNYPVWYRDLDKKLGVSRHLPWTFVSCETGVRKPDPRAYTQVTETLGCAPVDVVFIDDRAANVDAARAVGMRAIRFQGRDALVDDLVAMGIATD